MPYKNNVDRRAYSRRRKWRRKQEALTRYSISPFPICAYCGETDLKVLQLDHIDGGGNQHRKSLKKGKYGGWSFYMLLESQGYPEGYQVLCANCNIRKEYKTRGLYAGEI